MYYYPPYRSVDRSFIRIFHASPDAPPVDVYANGQLIARNLPYKGFTEYLQIAPGNYDIKVFPTGETSNPVIDTNLFIQNKTIYTVAAINKLENIQLKPIIDPKIPIMQDKAYVRFGHLSPNTPNVDITLPNGIMLFKDVGYKEITDYIAVDPGVYTVIGKPTGSDKIAITVPNIRLRPNRLYTIYAVGLLGGRPPLQVVIPLDGNTYLYF